MKRLALPTALALLMAPLVTIAGEALPEAAQLATRPILYDVDMTHFKRFDCGHESFASVVTLGTLPADVNLAIQRDGTLSDRDGKFRRGDLIGPGEEAIPTRRFVMAAIGRDRAYVAIEHGGLGYGIDVWAFGRKDSRWKGQLQGHMSELPMSELVFVQTICSPTGVRTKL